MATDINAIKKVDIDAIKRVLGEIGGALTNLGSSSSSDGTPNAQQNAINALTGIQSSQWENAFNQWGDRVSPDQSYQARDLVRSTGRAVSGGDYFNRSANAAANVMNMLFSPSSFSEETQAVETPTETEVTDKSTEQTSTGEDTETVTYTYKPGDNFGQVILDLGLMTDNGLWGTNGDVAYYTQQLVDQGVLDSNGNIPVGTMIKLQRRK